jgi:hypothetical protein
VSSLFRLIFEPDTTQPSIPSNVQATALNETTIRVTWSEATDNVGGSGISGYRVFRATTLSGTYTAIQDVGALTLLYSDSSLSAAQLRFYKVASLDAAGNVSALSAAVSATTQDLTAPTAPTITATAVSSSSVSIALTVPSTDAGVGVANYTLQRATDAGFTANLTTTNGILASQFPLSITGLGSSTQYFFRLRAVDAASNIGPFSTMSSATTQSAGGGNTLTHGVAATITGSGFGTQSAPFYQDGTGDMSWSEAYPVNAAAPAGSNMANRASPFTRPWGTSPIAVASPLPRAGMMSGGCSNIGDAYTRLNGMSRTVTVPAFPYYSVTRWWHRLDAIYADGGRNYKLFGFALGDMYHNPENWYIDYQPGQVPTSTSNPAYEINDDSSNGIRGTPGAQGVVGHWHSSVAGHYYPPDGSTGASIRNNFVMRELWMCHAALGTGRLALYEGAGIPVAKMDGFHRQHG